MRTTIILKGTEFHVFETKRAYYDFESAGHSLIDIVNGKVTAIMAFGYYATKACAKRENINFPYRSLEEFVDDDEISIKTLSKLFADVNKKDEPQPEGEAQPVK